MRPVSLTLYPVATVIGVGFLVGALVLPLVAEAAQKLVKRSAKENRS